MRSERGGTTRAWLWALVLTGCTTGVGGSGGSIGLGEADGGTVGMGSDGSGEDTDGADSTGGDTDGTDDGDGQIACGDPGQPACDCTATDPTGALVLGPCHPACQDTYWRWSMWTTNYNVSGTLGYGEHQGNGLIGYAYRYDPRFGPDQGVPPPWRSAAGALWTLGDGVSEAEQFEMRTMNPGAETYVPPVELPADEDDLWPSETLPLVPQSVEHPVVDTAALCEVPERVLDVRHYNHGRTLAETVPNHAWDSFFSARQLIPLHLLEVIELTVTAQGQSSSPTLPAEAGMPEAVDACLSGIDDGFCDSRCGNCSYVMPTGYSGTPFGAEAPGYQIQGIPAASAAPYTVGDAGPVAVRTNWSDVEDGHTVWYVGGSVWGRAEDIVGYTDYDDWPDPDGVSAEAPGDAWMSTAGADTQGGDGIPDYWTDPFTHCLDPQDGGGSQRPAGWPRFISGRWGHNSNSDSEASMRQFHGCATDPEVARSEAWTGTFACDACGLPRVDDAGGLVQHPCRDHTHTALSYWDRSPGTHDVDDLDPGKLDGVEAPRGFTDSFAALPKPVCGTSGQPVYGM